jgi:hypothetical protein
MNGRYFSLLLIASERYDLSSLADRGWSPQLIRRCKKPHHRFLLAQDIFRFEDSQTEK